MTKERLEKEVYLAALTQLCEELENYAYFWNDDLDNLHWDLFNKKVDLEVELEKERENANNKV